MTEAEWLTATEPEGLIEYLRVRGSRRKLRLFGVACCRSMLTRVTVNPWDRDAVTTAERFADGLASLEELAEAASETTSDWTAAFACAEVASVDAFEAAFHSAGNAAWAVADPTAEEVDESDLQHIRARSAERLIQVGLLRDIFGNPFRPVSVDPSWLTSTVVQLARGIYDERAFDRLPILADALQDAGCDNPGVLDHCRGPGPHVRGCWVVGLLLGKT